MKLFPILTFLLLAGCSVSKDPRHREIRRLYKQAAREDSSFVYTLPYEKGASHLLVQGYYSAFSHKNRVAMDFKMKPGTRVAAAREGVVVRATGTHDQGGWNRKYRQYANYIVVEHADGTRAGYWHLQKNGVLVNVGDTVRQGQVIGLSGNTGYSAFPHLHFMVWSNRNGQWEQLPTRFLTGKGPRYLKPGRKYKKGN